MSLLINLACIALGIYIIRNVGGLLIGLFIGGFTAMFGYKVVKKTQQDLRAEELRKAVGQ